MSVSIAGVVYCPEHHSVYQICALSRNLQRTDQYLAPIQSGAKCAERQTCEARTITIQLTVYRGISSPVRIFRVTYGVSFVRRAIMVLIIRIVGSICIPIIVVVVAFIVNEITETIRIGDLDSLREW